MKIQLNNICSGFLFVLLLAVPSSLTATVKPGTVSLKSIEPDPISNGDSYQQFALSLHNSYRKQCTSPALKLNDTLTKEGQMWANFQLEKKQKKIVPLPTRPDYNVLFFTQNQILEPKAAIQQAIEGWYSDKKSYNWDTPKASGFSEIVWKSTTDIGIGFATREGKTVVAVTYWPPGNIYLLGPGDRGMFFKENVPKQC